MIKGDFRETEADRQVSDMVKAINMEVPSLFTRVMPLSQQQGNDEGWRCSH